MTTEERDAIVVGNVVLFKNEMAEKTRTGTVIHAGYCGLDVRVKDEIYNVYRSEVVCVWKGEKTKESV